MTFFHNSAGSYQNFSVAIYARVYEVQQMADLDWLAARFDAMSRHIKVDKVYLETHRDTIVADEETITRVQQYFESRGICTSGGITLTVNERNRFETYCYTNPEHRQKVKEVVEYTARLFDEVILDDFFFTGSPSLAQLIPHLNLPSPYWGRITHHQGAGYRCGRFRNGF